MRMFFEEIMNIGIFMWVEVIGRRGERRRQVHHAKEEHETVIMAWFTRESGEMGMLGCKRF